MGLDGVVFRDLQDQDLEWVLQAMAASMKATISEDRSATTEGAMLGERARADLDRYHFQAKGEDKFIIAVRASERIGLAWVTMEQLHQDPGAAFLLDIFVEPSHRGNGLGRELLGRAEAWAREKGSNGIWLNVGGGNDAALHLYRSQGYDVATLHMRKRF